MNIQNGVIPICIDQPQRHVRRCVQPCFHVPSMVMRDACLREPRGKEASQVRLCQR
jgi:hypothetical protein